ncbi:MAG: SMP-30/gluconolactonase/LRE family protein [Planctomycetaceae bacterium]|nr:SMP-30/gluconolactonase/LRE family protein [Planctomycetaceae bacterium]
MLRSICLLTLLGLFSSAYGEDLPVVWRITEGISAPESIYFDADTGCLFLSQIREGGGKAKDGDGGISKLSVDGKMVDENWVTGLNAPKGLRSHGGTLWVSDIDQLVSVDIATGKITRRLDVPDAVFLNDVACGTDGSVYVSDMAAGKIIRFKDEKLSVFAEGPELQNPNGLLVHDGGLLLGGWGTEFNPADFSTKETGQLLRLDLKTKKVTVVTPERIGHIDGIEIDGEGGYVVSDWPNGKVMHVNSNGEATTLLSLPKGTADIAVLLPQGILLLPEMLENRLTAYQLDLK